VAIGDGDLLLRSATEIGRAAQQKVTVANGPDLAAWTLPARGHAGARAAPAARTPAWPAARPIRRSIHRNPPSGMEANFPGKIVPMVNDFLAKPA
jgi:hypothetical protein